jgi:CarD family transcriptional regulator
MARKTTSNKGAVRKADARKPAPKPGVRSLAAAGKAASRKAPPAHASVPAKRATSKSPPPKASHPDKVLAKRPATPAKPAAQPKAVAAAKAPPPAIAAKPLPPKAVLPKPGASPAGAHARAIGVPKQVGVMGRMPIPAATKAVVQKTMLARQQTAVSKQAVAAAAMIPKKPVHQRHGFKTNEWIVYPAHGVGRIVGIEEQEIAGMTLELFVITFEKDKMTLRVPTGKSQSVGMRKLAEDGVVKRAMETLKGRARIKRTMWSRRAQEYEAKINSGDLVAIAEVVRDLYRSESQPEQSYSERQLYEAALDRMARELAAVEKLDERGAVQRITEVLAKSAKGRRVAAEEAAAEVKAA